MTHRCGVGMLLVGLMLFSLALGAAEVGAVSRDDRVHCKDGSVLRGTILMVGSRGVVLVTVDGERLEQFVPRKSIARLELREADAAPGDAAGPPGNAVQRYQAEPQDGRLALVELGGGKSPARPARPEAPRAAGEEASPRKKTARRRLAPMFQPRPVLRGEEKDAKRPAAGEDLFGDSEGDTQPGRRRDSAGSEDDTW